MTSLNVMSKSLFSISQHLVNHCIYNIKSFLKKKLMWNIGYNSEIKVLLLCLFLFDLKHQRHVVLHSQHRVEFLDLVYLSNNAQYIEKRSNDIVVVFA